MSPADREKTLWSDIAMHFAGRLMVGGGIGATIFVATLYAL